MNLDNYRTSHSSKEYGGFYDKTYAEDGYYKTQWIELERPLLQGILQRIKEKSGDAKSLDFACGTGRILEVHENYFDNPYGVDVSESMVDIARDRCKKSNIILQDITKEPLSGSFDVVTAFRFFLNAEQDLRKDVLNALRGNLSDSGYLVVNNHVNSQSLLGLAYRARNKWLKKCVANTLSYDEFEKLLNDAGFQIKEVYWYSYWPRIGGRGKWLSRVMLPLLDRIWKLLRLPKSYAQSYILVCIKEEQRSDRQV